MCLHCYLSHRGHCKLEFSILDYFATLGKCLENDQRQPQDRKLQHTSQQLGSEQGKLIPKYPMLIHATKISEVIYELFFVLFFVSFLLDFLKIYISNVFPFPGVLSINPPPHPPSPFWVSATLTTWVSKVPLLDPFNKQSCSEALLVRNSNGWILGDRIIPVYCGNGFVK